MPRHLLKTTYQNWSLRYFQNDQSNFLKISVSVSGSGNSLEILWSMSCALPSLSCPLDPGRDNVRWGNVPAQWINESKTILSEVEKSRLEKGTAVEKSRLEKVTGKRCAKRTKIRRLSNNFAMAEQNLIRLWSLKIQERFRTPRKTSAAKIKRWGNIRWGRPRLFGT